ncbi:MAG: hypothetical protein GXO82_08055, partial [Chlorobi bacterium]|nr:hypothetical protein [Chlorobiota bacterium]
MNRRLDPAFRAKTTNRIRPYRTIPGCFFSLFLLVSSIASSTAVPERHIDRSPTGDVKESFVNLPAREQGDKETRESRPQPEPVVDLRGKAAFMPGDDPIFRSKYIDESLEWNFIPVPGAWERYGYGNLDGVAWYRFRFRLTPEQRKDSLVVIMSAIDDADQTFLNSAPIGATGSFPPATRSEWATPRVYDLPDSILEEYNSLAVRVYDRSDSGGIRGAVLGVYRKRDAARVLTRPDPVLSTKINMHLLNGSGIAVYSPVMNAVTAWYPHVYSELDPGLPTENILSRAEFRFSLGDSAIRLGEKRAASNRYLEQSSVVQSAFS